MSKTLTALICVVLVMAGSGCEKGLRAEDDPVSSRRAGDTKLRSECENQLKHLGLVIRTYARESEGQRFPALSPETGRLAFGNNGVIYPEYLTDLGLLVCPADEDQKLLMSPVTGQDPAVMLDDHSYYYLGYAVQNEADVDRFAKAYQERVEKGQKFDKDLDTPQGPLFFLREGIGRFLITDINSTDDGLRAQAAIPLLIERPDNHEPPGGNVLFLDGHVEFIRYGERWPMTKTVLDTLRSLEGME
jgi:prepilin-type processing-associated H-X9-DG protein